MTGLRSWLDAADRLLADGDDDEEAVDELLDAGLALDIPAGAGPDRLDLDPAVLQRVVFTLAARRAAVASELADIARRRSQLIRSGNGMAGYVESIHLTR